jgi:hypothetical protein
MKRVAVVGLWLVPAVALAITPTNGGLVSGTGVTIDNSSGNQTDPHVSGNLAAYTDLADKRIHYYDFSSAANAFIPPGDSLADTLSDVSGNLVSFTRQTPAGDFEVAVFDVSTSTVTLIAPDAGDVRLGSALGGNTLAFVDFTTGNQMGDIFAVSLPGGTPVQLTSSDNADGNPNVSPDGNAIVWESCPTPSNCDVMKSVATGGVWSAPELVIGTAFYEENPDTDGTTVVYDTNATSSTSPDIVFQPLSGPGAATVLELAGAQVNPSISGGIIGFESTPPSAIAPDIYIYVIATNTIYQVTNTPGISEQLNDIVVLPSGQVRAVWAANDGPNQEFNVYATTFSVPTATNTCLNRSAALVASRSTPPTNWTDAHQSFSSPFSFALPASMAVTQGNASNKHLTLSWTDSCGAEQKCHYHGAAGGSQYVFDHCMGSVSGLNAGSVVTVTDVTLHVDDASNSAHTTTVSVTLAEACGTTAPVCGSGGGDDGDDDHHSTGGHVCMGHHGDEGHSDEELSTQPQPMGCSATGAMLPMMLAALALLLVPRRAAVRSTRRQR